MITINEKEEFIQIIASNSKVVCFVYSNWSNTSVFGHLRYKELVANNPGTTFVLINNESADSFIYEWLTKLKTKRNGNWINGNGELFGILNSDLAWFENSILELENNELISKIKFKDLAI